MYNIILVVIGLILISATSFGGISEKKCEEYSQLFKDTIQVSHPDEGNVDSENTLGKVPAAPGEFPHMVHLGFQSDNETTWACGGSLISDEYVLTAAICATSYKDEPIRAVRLGDYDITSKNDDVDVQEFKVKEVIPHPGHRKPSLYNDIALVKLDGKVKFTKRVHPACLYSNESLSDDIEISAIGWGQVEYGGHLSDILMKVYLDHFSNQECNNAYKSASNKILMDGIVEKLMFCAGGRNSSKDTCQGDVGGPLQTLNENVYKIIGITSFGKTCGLVGVPGVYTRVSGYVPWIESIVWS